MSPKQTLFSSLPYELYQHILSFGVDRELLTPSSRNSQVSMVATFQSLSKKINESTEMQQYFNEFWWKVFERYFGINPFFANDLDKLREEMIKTRQLKRKILIAKYIKFKVLRHPSYNPNNPNSTSELKVVMLGEGGVGKSALTIFFMQNFFVDQYDPTIEDSYRKHMKVDEIPVMFDVLDTAGPEEYSAMRDQYIRTGEAFVMVCAVNDPQLSLREVRPRVEQLLRVKDRDLNDTPIIFAINKIDLLTDSDRKQTIEEFRKEINSVINDLALLNTSIVETSAKTGENVTLIYEEAARRHRYGNIDNITLLKNVVELDSLYIDECRKGIKRSKKCSVM